MIASLRALSGNVAVFSHGQFGCSLAARWIELAVAQAQHLQMDPASISELTFDPDHPEIPVMAHWNGLPATTPRPALVLGRSVGGYGRQRADKQHAARAASGEIQSGMVVGIGTGSTVAELIPILAARVRDGLRITAVATSEATAAAARAAGIEMIAFDDRSTIDLTIDGVDEIDGSLRAIKGAGGALLREKIVGTASCRMIAIADGAKHSPAIGRRPVPIEILPFAQTFVLAAISTLGATPTLRLIDGVPARSDQAICWPIVCSATLPS